MKTNRLRGAILALLVLVTGGCSNYAFQPPPCDEATSRIVARVYVLSIPLLSSNDEFFRIVETNPDAFAEDGLVVRCMRTVGRGLAQQGASAMQTYRTGSAVERFGGMMPEGLSHLPGQVDSSLQSYGTDVYAMGEELVWLSQVLPAVSRGDRAPYNAGQTTSRQLARQAIPVYQMICQMDRSMCQVMFNAIQQVVPTVEETIYRMARQLGG